MSPTHRHRNKQQEQTYKLKTTIDKQTKNLHPPLDKFIKNAVTWTRHSVPLQLHCFQHRNRNYLGENEERTLSALSVVWSFHFLSFFCTEYNRTCRVSYTHAHVITCFTLYIYTQAPVSQNRSQNSETTWSIYCNEKTITCLYATTFNSSIRFHCTCITLSVIRGFPIINCN